MTGEQPCQQESGQSDEDSNHSAVLGQHLGGLFASPDGVPHGIGEDPHQEHDMLSPSRVPFQGHNISFFEQNMFSSYQYQVQKYLK